MMPKKIIKPFINRITHKITKIGTLAIGWEKLKV